MHRGFLKPAVAVTLGIAAVAAFLAGGMASSSTVPALILALTLIALMALIAYERAVVARLGLESKALAQSVNLLELAESLAGVGRWRYDHASGQHTWSPELCALLGIYPPRQPDAALLDEVLGPDGGGLVATLTRHAGDLEAYTVEFEIRRQDGEHRLLRAKARNEFAGDGTTAQVFMVARDVTEQYEQVRFYQVEQQRALAIVQRERELANTDPLTGLANRRFALRKIDQALLKARKNRQPLALVVFDLDHFKSVNDTHGHLAGDRVLARIAALTRVLMPDGDLAARFGGEEFVCLLNDADPEQAHEFSEQLRRSIEMDSAFEDLPGVTASVGYASFLSADTSMTLFARADAALYAAKQAGRNVVRMAA